jgi:hypothetical protein
MALITKSNIEELVSAQNGLCVSIFIPTHRAGSEVLSNQDSILFKNKIRDAKNLLMRHDLTEKEAIAFLKPAEDLLHDSNLWRHQQEGMAVFISKGFSKHFSLPIRLSEEVFVLDHFYLTPILPMLGRSGHFYILSLNQNKVQLFEATYDHIKEIDLSEFMPTSFEEALKYDVIGNDQDFTHSTTTVNGSNIVHGAGSTKGDEEYLRVREFLIEVDRGLQKVLHDQKAPLVLASTDRNASVFKQISQYKKNIVEEEVRVDVAPGVLKVTDLHKKSINALLPHLRKEHVEWLSRYQDIAGTGKTSEDIQKVAAEAVHGRVDALFITPSNPVWGTYDEESATTVVHEEYHKGDYDLVNLAAINTLTQGGRVFVSDYEGMAEVTNGSPVKAVFRY